MDSVNASPEISGVQVIVTQTGNHTPEQWSQAIAKMVFQADELAPHLKEMATEVLTKLTAALTPHITKLTETEAKSLAADPGHSQTPLQAREPAIAAVPDLQAAALGSSWEALLKSEAWATNAIEEIEHQFKTVLATERSWFADLNKVTP